jgi:ATP-dependent protease ClpP protease subunit
MTEQKPAEQYNVIPNAEMLIHPAEGGNGQTPTIDEQSRQTAMARAMIENEKQARVQACAAEIDKALTEILRRNKCAAKFMELREGGQTTRIWLQPVAVDEPAGQ